MSELCAEQINYKNEAFLFEKAKEVLSGSGKNLTQNDITDLICGENFTKHATVYNLIGKILKMNDDVFTRDKGKYFLKTKPSG